MPIYEYFCPKCGIEFELVRPISKSNEAAFCPKCGLRGEKLVSVFAQKIGPPYKSYIKVPQKAFRKPHKGEGENSSM